MEKIFMCKTLIATYKDDTIFLDGPHISRFDLEKREKFHIIIEQNGIRKITVISEKDVMVNDLISIFSRIERLMMLFDGAFINLSKIEFTNSDETEENRLHMMAEHYMRNRLSYFNSADFCDVCMDKMIDFQETFTPELFGRWEKILEELDIVHQMYLYSVSKSRLPVDIKCAFLIELAEPLVEVVKLYTNKFEILVPGNKGTTLKCCLKALIEEYGQDIFKEELSSNNYEAFLATMVNSRVRIMHIKRKQSKNYFNGNESVLYSLKMSLLYRKIIFELLQFDSEKYEENLKKCVSRLNKWNDCLERFMIKLSENN